MKAASEQPTGDPEDCPAHSTDWLYAAVRQNRVNLGYASQPCTCAHEFRYFRYEERA